MVALAFALGACANGFELPPTPWDEPPRASRTIDASPREALLPRYRVDERGPALPPPPGLDAAAPQRAIDAVGSLEATERPVVAARGGPVRVGLLLPLSGPSAATGQSLLAAAQLAVFELGSEAIEVLPRDTRGVPDGAAAAAREVIAAGADLIVGPLFSNEADAVVGVAQPRRVNVVAFSNDLAVWRPGLYLMGHAPPGQIRRLLAHHAAQGGRAVAVLAPADAYGRIAAEAAMDEAARYGLVVTAARLLRADLQGNALAREMRSFLAEAGGADGLILPFPAERLLQVAPVLDHLDLDRRRVRLMGTEVWEHPHLARERALAGAIYAAPQPDGRAAFRARYRQTFGAAPAPAASLAYDAIALAAVIASNAATTPIGRAALTEPNGFIGTDGLFRLRSDGPAERGLAIIEVTPRGTRVLEPAPTDFRTPGQRMVGG